MTECKETTLAAYQAVLLQMLRDFDAICRKYEIPYMLFAGTALGAVRHQGFIPWDDDLDVMMLRPDYERFLQVAPAELNPEVYYLQREFSPHWPMFFSKLRKNHTACMERLIPKDPQMHQGVYIDIFPCDNLSDNALVRKLQFYCSKVVIAKSLDRRGYLTDSRKKKLFMACCRLIPGKPLARFVQKRGGGNSQMVHCFFGAASKYEKSIFPRAWLTERTEAAFEDGRFPISAHYDELLTTLYGDYKTPTPPSQRGCKVHGEIVDLEHSYEDYLEIQKNRPYSEYSRSIR